MSSRGRSGLLGAGGSSFLGSHFESCEGEIDGGGDDGSDEGTWKGCRGEKAVVINATSEVIVVSFFSSSGGDTRAGRGQWLTIYCAAARCVRVSYHNKTRIAV